MAPAAAAAAAKATTALSSARPASAFKPSVDLWSDLLMACLVIFVVLAPSYFFRVEQPTGRTSDKKRQNPRKVFRGNMGDGDARKRQRRDHATASQAAIAGAVSGGATRLLAAPLDLVKIRFQVQQAPISRAHTSAKYVGFIQSISSIHAEEGIKSFWRGNLAATGLWVSYSAIQFGAYKQLHAFWPEDIARRHATLVSSTNGASAGVVATLVTYPLDLFRTVFASQGVPKPYPTMQSLAIHTFETRGVRGFYSGIGPTLFQIAPYMGLSFGIYSTLNNAIADANAASPLVGVKWALSFVGSGAVAGLLSKLAVYPLDTVKKRMQVRHIPRCKSYGEIPVYGNSWQCFTDILKREGIVGLYKGTGPSLLKSVITHSSTFAVYEVTLAVLESLDE